MNQPMPKPLAILLIIAIVFSLTLAALGHISWLWFWVIAAASYGTLLFYRKK